MKAVLKLRSVLAAIAISTATVAVLPSASQVAHADGGDEAYRARLAERIAAQGGVAPPPSVAEMLARERTHTYRVDMSKVASGDPREPRAASWRDECLATKVDDWKVGAIPDRTHFCSHAHLMLGTFDTPNGLLGKVSFDWLVYGEGSVGSSSQRTLTFHQELTNVRSDPDAPWPANKPLTASIGCAVQVPKTAPKGACQGTAFATKTITDWQRDPKADTNLWSDENSVKDPALEPQVGEEKVVMVGFTPTVTSVQPSRRGQTAAPTGTADPPDPINTVSMNGYARYDSAQYLNTKKGAIFRGVVPHLSYDPSKTRVKEVAEHIRDACDKDKVNDSYPAGDGNKLILGCDITHLIHRVTEKKVGWPKPSTGQKSRHELRYNANKNAKTRNCKPTTPTIPDTPGTKECDEFPFASTYEGAAASEHPASEFAGGGKPNQFSIRKVDATTNNLAGRDLQTWLNNDRILDWATGGSSSTSSGGLMRDGYWVRIGPT